MLSFSVTIEICDWRERGKNQSAAVSGCASFELVTGDLQLRREDGFKLQTHDAPGTFHSRWRPLLVKAEALQGLLSSLFGLELVDHLTRQKVGTFVAPAEGLHTNTTAAKKMRAFTLDNQKHRSRDAFLPPRGGATGPWLG